MKEVTLENLVNRFETDQILLAKYPENKDYLNRRIRETKELIACCVLRNMDKKELMREFKL